MSVKTESKPKSPIDMEEVVDPKKYNRDRIRNRRRKKTFIALGIVLIAFLIGLYFNSEYATVRKITIKGNSFVSDHIIEDALQINVEDYRISTYKKNIKQIVANIPGIKSVTIHNNPFQGLVIEVEENNLIAFTREGDQYRLIFEDGLICDLNDIELLPKVQMYPLCLNFGEDLAVFATNFARIRETIRTQFSDITYSNEIGDPEKITIYTNDGKTIYCRLDDMVNQINHYNDVMAAYPNSSYYDFIGDKVYMG